MSTKSFFLLITVLIVGAVTIYLLDICSEMQAEMDENDDDWSKINFEKYGISPIYAAALAATSFSMSFFLSCWCIWSLLKDRRMENMYIREVARIK